MKRDKYGGYEDISISGITQRLRWIEPGDFMMGSPPDEPGRNDDEQQHKVTLTNGFWLADTACTQRLWEAVTGSNPSLFKGINLPVENISWHDCQQFVKKVNSKMPGLDLRLPTEAEWEYACRAGTTTPFSFGRKIDTKEVNYDGNFPYDNGERGEYRKKTVEVKSLPCNDWGLFEMHGNVWEWCSDRYGAYTTDSVTDPTGSSSGWYRVCRGGGWIDVAVLTRSACRDGGMPGDRDVITGFRLARGQ